jgi:hypothetical protein
VQRRLFVRKRDEVAGGRRKVHNEELHNLYFSPNIIRMIKSKDDEMSVACSTHRETKNAYKFFFGKPEGKIPLGRPRRRREYNVKTNHREIWEYMYMYWISLAHVQVHWRTVVNTANTYTIGMNKGGKFLDQLRDC